MNTAPFRLSYPLTTLEWNGQFMDRLPADRYMPQAKLMKSLGVDALMLTGYVTIEDACFDVDDETKRVGDLIDAAGLGVAQHHGLCATWAAPGSSQDEVVERMVKCARWTANLHSGILVIHPGQSLERHATTEEYHLAFKDAAARIGLDELLGVMAANINAAAEAARGFGVTIAVENADFFKHNDALLTGLFAKLSSPNVGFCMDFGHAHFAGCGVDSWLDALGDRMVTTHIHDNCGKADEHMPPGFGTIPWIDVIVAMRRLGYDGYANFESGPWPEIPEMEGYRNAIAFWRECEAIASERVKNEQ